MDTGFSLQLDTHATGNVLIHSNSYVINVLLSALIKLKRGEIYTIHTMYSFTSHFFAYNIKYCYF